MIIKNNPHKINLDKIRKKIQNINPLYTETDFGRPNNKTDELYYKYNILYGSNTNNLIRTYSPKMRPVSSSIASFTQSLTIDNRNDYQVFNEEEIELLLEAKIKDLGLDYREEMNEKFHDYCRKKCINRRVDLTDSHVSYYSITVLANILFSTDKIAFLDLTKNYIGDVGVGILCEAIQSSRSLVSLNVTSNNISHKGGEMLLNMLLTQISIISFNISSIEGINRNRICSDGLKLIVPVLQKNILIEDLNLSGNSIKNEGFKLLSQGMNNNAHLHTLDISNNDIDQEGLIDNLDKIKGSKLIELNISNNPMKNEGLMKLTDCIVNFSLLKNINVSNCGIDFTGFSYLFNHLQTIKRLETLNISSNNLMSKKFESIKMAFQQCGIKYLNMSKCNLCNTASYALGNCLSINESIRKIELRENKIYDKGFRSFISLPKSNSSIYSFDISKNYLSDATVKEFIQNLANNKTMSKVNFYDNQLENDSGTAMIEVLIKNRALTNVNFIFNKIQLKLIDEINSRTKENIDKIKKKRIPNIRQEIKKHQFKPDEPDHVKKRIVQERYTSRILNGKLKEDTIAFDRMKKSDQKAYDKLVKENEKIEEHIQALDEEIKKIMNDTKIEQGQIITQEELYHNEIEEVNQEIINQKKLNEERINERNELEANYEFEINQMNQKVKISFEKMNLTEISWKSLLNDLKKKSEIYENAIKEVSSPSRRQSKAGVSRRTSNINANSPFRRSSLRSGLLPNQNTPNLLGKTSERNPTEEDGKSTAKGKRKGKGKGKGSKGKGKKKKKGKEKATNIQSNVQSTEETKIKIIKLVDIDDTNKNNDGVINLIPHKSSNEKRMNTTVQMTEESTKQTESNVIQLTK